tara:strand:+ start:1253 stop:2173 length:921 start_codon:yes stop_codon:yes gene_type:complete
MATSNAKLFLNAYEKTISYKGVQKQINDTFWEEHFVPILYPLWDNPKDRLELFVYKEDGSYLIEKNKYTKNFKTGETKWVSYEFDPNGVDEVSVNELVDKLTDVFLQYKEVSEAEYEVEVQKKFAVGQILTWARVKAVRSFLLQDSDYTQLPDSPVSDEVEKALWVQYRHYLRDFLQLQSPQSPYDVIFPITPKEYLQRKSLSSEFTPEQLEVYGEQGNDKDYLTSEYHFWKLSSNGLKSFSQRMSTFIALKSLTTDDGPYGRIDVAKYNQPSAENSVAFAKQWGKIQEEKGYLDELLSRIESGEV